MALYLTFILVGALLFAFVYFYSVRAQRAKRAKADQGLSELIDGNAVSELSKGSAKIPGPKVKATPAADDSASDDRLDKVNGLMGDEADVVARANANTHAATNSAAKVDTVEDVAGAAGATAQAQSSATSTTTSTIGSTSPVERVVDASELGAQPDERVAASSAMAATPAVLNQATSGTAPSATPAVIPGTTPRTAPGVPSEPTAAESAGVKQRKAPSLPDSNTPLKPLPNNDSTMATEPSLQQSQAANTAGDKGVANQSGTHSSKQNMTNNAAAAGSQSANDIGADASHTFAQNAAEQPQELANLSWDERECELVAKILGENVIVRDDVLAIYRKYDFMLVRKLHIFGFNTLTQMWSDVEREDVSAVFTDLGVSVQLADKSGALTRKELNAVSQLVLELSDTYDRKFSFSMDLDEAIEVGRELDELGRRHSAMVVLNIVPKRKEGFRSSDIDSCARDLNMSQSDVGVFTRYRRENARSTAQYHVAVADDTGQFRPVKKQSPFRIHDIVVYLNVPAVENPSDAFVKMVDEARKLATWLDGKLVDKHRRNMTTKAIRVLTDQVGEIERHMLQDGIAPGGPLSQKIF